MDVAEGGVNVALESGKDKPRIDRLRNSEHKSIRNEVNLQLNGMRTSNEVLWKTQEIYFGES